jgi:hypothetical protein
MSEWWNNLPWKQLGAGAVTALAAALGGVGGRLSVDADEASAGQRVQMAEMMRHMGEEPLVTLKDDAHSLRALYYESDGCWLMRRAESGAVVAHYLLAPGRIPQPPELPFRGLQSHAGISGLPCPQGNCISPADHVAPVEQEYGGDLGEGWVEVLLQYQDLCRLQTAFHPPSGSWLPIDKARWVCCSH